MAKPQHSDAEKGAVRQLVNDICSVIDGNVPEIARKIGVSEAALRDWRAGRRMPEAPNLLRMLRYVGWLRSSDDGSGPDPRVSEPLEALAARFEAVVERLEHLARPQPGRGRGRSAL